jgi:hypothetical protein
MRPVGLLTTLRTPSVFVRTWLQMWLRVVNMKLTTCCTNK